MNTELPSDYVEILKKEYPRRLGDNGWLHVRTLVPRAVTMGATWARILAGTRAYKAHCDSTAKTGTELVKQARTFYGPSQYFDEWADMEPIQTPRQSAEAARWAGLRARSEAIGFRAPTAVETTDSYETVLRRAERERMEACQRPASSAPGNVVAMLAKAKRL